MHSIAKTYRSVLPRSLREPLWHARSAVWGSVAGRGAGERRRHRALILSAVGRPFATVAINGLRLRVDLRDEGVGRPIYVDREYEPSETRFLRANLKPGMTFVDIGANIGYFSTLGAGLVGERGRVIAFEPDPHNFGLLAGNLDLNGIRTAEPLEFALGEGEREMRLFRSGSNYGDHRLYGDPGEDRESLTIQVRSLDAILGARGIAGVDLIKMDVQGFEHHVLRGMKATLEAGRRPIVLSEFWPHGIELAGGSPREFLGFFESAGYSVETLNPDGSTRPIGFDRAFAEVPRFDPLKPDHSYLNLVFAPG